jgi:hypothetical protein
LEVQTAVSAGRLSAGAAEEVAGLTRPVQAQIAEAIRAGGDPTQVVRQHLPKKAKRHKHAWQAFVGLTKAPESWVANLQGRTGQVGWISPEEQEALQRSAELIEKLREKARQQPEDQPGPRAMLADFQEGQDGGGTL